MTMQNSLSVEALTIRVGRRGFLGASAAAGLLSTTVVGRAAALDPAPVGAVYNDQPYLDRSGRVAPYRPPTGTRSGDAAAALDEATLRHAHCYL